VRCRLRLRCGQCFQQAFEHDPDIIGAVSGQYTLPAGPISDDLVILYFERRLFEESNLKQSRADTLNIISSRRNVRLYLYYQQEIFPSCCGADALHMATWQIPLSILEMSSCIVSPLDLIWLDKPGAMY